MNQSKPTAIVQPFSNMSLEEYTRYCCDEETARRIYEMEDEYSDTLAVALAKIVDRLGESGALTEYHFVIDIVAECLNDCGPDSGFDYRMRQFGAMKFIDTAEK